MTKLFYLPLLHLITNKLCVSRGNPNLPGTGSMNFCALPELLKHFGCSRGALFCETCQFCICSDTHFSCKRTMWPPTLPDKVLKHTDPIFEVWLWEAPISEQVNVAHDHICNIQLGEFWLHSYSKVFLIGT